jgi:hypothetical protein
VAVFPDAYGAYVKRLRADSAARAQTATARKAQRPATRRASAAKVPWTASAAIRTERSESEALAAVSLVAFWLALAFHRQRTESREAL